MQSKKGRRNAEYVKGSLDRILKKSTVKSLITHTRDLNVGTAKKVLKAAVNYTLIMAYNMGVGRR